MYSWRGGLFGIGAREDGELKGKMEVSEDRESREEVNVDEGSRGSEVDDEFERGRKFRREADRAEEMEDEGQSDAGKRFLGEKKM